MKKKNELSNEIIFELREKGMSYERIAKYFNTEGIKITPHAIGYRCKKIYREKGKKEPKAKIKNYTEDEELIKLREQGMSFERIADYYKEKGIKVAVETIESRCKKAFEKRKKKMPSTKKKIEVLDEEIYQLREQGMSYERIVEYYSKKGIEITHQAIGYRCKKIYEEKGKKEPKSKRENHTEDEELIKLKEKGMSYERIADYYNEKGIKVTVETIESRCKKAFEKRKKKMPSTKKKIEVLDEEIYQLREQGMSYERIVEYYSKKGIEITHQAIGYRCKKIYEEKGKEEPKAKKGKKERDDVTNEELYELREKGMKYEEIVKYFEEKGIKISQSQVCKRCKKIYEEKGEDAPKVTRKNKKPEECLLGRLDDTLNGKIKEKIGTERKLAELKDKERNTEGAEK